jgi:hypothetical protein
MRRQFLEELAERRPMIKTCWEVLLRAEPPASALGNPDTLVFMMDRTLDAFFAAADSPTPRRWLARHPRLCQSLGQTCPCQHNPLLCYFISGEQAILAIAGRILAEWETCREEDQILSRVHLTFHYLAQSELQTFCDLCNAKCVRSLAVAGRRAFPPAGCRPTRIPRLRPQWEAVRL